MQRLNIDRRFLGSAAVERLCRSLKQLILPLRDLIRVNVELLRELRNGSVALDRRQRDFRFEYRSVACP